MCSAGGTSWRVLRNCIKFLIKRMLLELYHSFNLYEIFILN